MTTPQSSPQSHQSAQVSTGLPTNWLHRLKVGQKIGLGYATTLGIAVVGIVTGIVLGNVHQHRALEIQEDAIDEIIELKDLETALMQLSVNERDLVTWLDSPEQFQATYQAYQDNALAFQVAWEELLEEYEEDEAEGLEREEELEFLENLVETYDGVLETYLAEVERFIEDLPLTELQGSRLTQAQQTLIEFNRRPASLKVQAFSAALSEMVESIEVIELEEAEAAVQTAARLRMRVIGISITLSLIVASLLAWLISRAINRPLKAVEETALQVTRDKNFNLRAAVVSGDEVGTLATALNQLIEWVGTHTHALTLAQQDLKAQTQELNAIIDNLGDGLLVIDPKGYVTRSNPSLRELFSLNGTPLGGQPVEGIFDQRITDLVSQNQTAPATSLSAELALSENRVGQALVTAIIPDAATVAAPDQVQSAGSVVLIRDITAEKE
ncbi:MAG: HAMP domain-containing protein, partial [Cyanobacteria bacterium P01_F01_bin.4]